MNKIDVKKVYSQSELVAELKRAGELLEACEAEGCRVEECEGCTLCETLFDAVNFLELSFYLASFDLRAYLHSDTVGWSSEYLYTQAEEFEDLSAEEFEELARRSRRAMRAYLFNLQSEARSISFPRSRRELEERWVDQPVSIWEEY